MLAKIPMILTAWFLVSLIVGLLLGRTISMLREAPSPGFIFSLESDVESATLSEAKEQETLNLAHA